MSDPSSLFATPRLAAGALFSRDSEVLLVHKTYGNGWDIPGGYVDRGESPAVACQREVREELGLTRVARRLLVHDWAPNENEGDKMLYVFDCGELGDESLIHLDNVEIDNVEWVSVGSLARYVIPRLARRLTSAYSAYVSGEFIYLEYGHPVAGMATASGTVDFPADS
jgi:8-oxo-dGTP diphosphatase